MLYRALVAPSTCIQFISPCILTQTACYNRAGISPFVSASSVLESLKAEKDDKPNDILRLCRDVQLEVIQLR